MNAKDKKAFVARMKKGRVDAKRRATPKRKARVKKAPKRKVTRKASVKKTPKRKTNPVSAKKVSKTHKINQSIKLFRNFRNEEPEFIDSVKMNIPDVGMVIGKLDGVMYTTTRNGETEKYLHKFTGRSRPTLCASWDGKQLIIVEGNYDFTRDGIVDL